MSAKLGELASWESQRDAVHVAIAPCMAPEKVYPGQRVDAWGRPGTGQDVGIVDPFLAAPVERGQRFFILLFPGTVTDLRHEWNHPAFDDNSDGDNECSDC